MTPSGRRARFAARARARSCSARRAFRTAATDGSRERRALRRDTRRDRQVLPASSPLAPLGRSPLGVGRAWASRPTRQASGSRDLRRGRRVRPRRNAKGNRRSRASLRESERLGRDDQACRNRGGHGGAAKGARRETLAPELPEWNAQPANRNAFDRTRARTSSRKSPPVAYDPGALKGNLGRRSRDRGRKRSRTRRGLQRVAGYALSGTAV